ncbi:undecaprenyl-phosphate glucose phosphotransferase [Marinobacter fonticola]|uniref:undecaprenyl-phosphate glucose phosphotransferase n=1 Tax=Marinobacter fonticola TaxID=2603215 RepID=UPI0011E738EC|nr:undecaprenyl-phosphate glucose phosphotransferase [Marinobacter fonticola]
MDWNPTTQNSIRAASAFSPVIKRPRRLLQNHDNLLHYIQIGLSIIISAAVMFSLAWWRDDGVIHGHYRTLALIAGLLILVVYEWRGVFRRFSGRIDTCMRLARSWLLVTTLAVFTTFVTKTSEDFSRMVIISWAALGYVAQVMAYQISYKLSQRYRHTRRQPIRAVVLGSYWLAEHLVESITSNAWMPDRVVGVIDENKNGLDRWVRDPVPYLGDFDELLHILEDSNITRVYIALPITCSATIEEACRKLADVPVDVVWVPDIFAMRLLNHSVKELNGLPLISLSESPLVSQSQAMTKNLLDKTIALLALTLLSPLMLTVSYLVWQSSPGPILFKQKRHGWDGRVIEVWKFRSMFMHFDKRVKQATKHDDRITRVGRFIRRTSLDELPQLFNVLQGTMSLVGPRPHAIEHNDLYTNKIQSYMLRHRIKPGMTGLAQVNGLRGETDTLEKMLRRVELDLEYINTWSIWSDVKILIKTPFSLFSKTAY